MWKVSNRPDLDKLGSSGVHITSFRVNNIIVDIAHIKAATRYSEPEALFYRVDVSHVIEQRKNQLFEVNIYNDNLFNDDTYHYIKDLLPILKDSENPEILSECLDKIFKFIFKYNSSSLSKFFDSLIWRSYNTGFKEGKEQLQSSLKDLLNIEY